MASWFYGRLQGDGNELTRRGTKASGLVTVAETKDFKIRVYLHHDGAQDLARVELHDKYGNNGRVLFASSHPLDGLTRDGWKEHLVALLEQAGRGVMDEIMQEYATKKLREHVGEDR